MITSVDNHYMRLALNQARKGLGRTSPNPCVGAVIVKNNTVIAKGYHRRAGAPHAEINALKMAGADASGAVMYVTMEPCNHTGRTPPCSHAVAGSGIKKVVIGMLDPNPLVNGAGADYLRDRGIEVVSGVLGDACTELNRPFLKYITTSLPWVIMKAGVSLDGRITYRHGEQGTITGPESLRQVHRLRDRADAILVGIGTVVADDPSLTTRLPKGQGKNPIRIILDTTLRIDENARVLRATSESPTWLFCSTRADSEKMKRLESLGILVHPLETEKQRRLNVEEVLRVAGDGGITSILVEGGATIHGSFLKRRLVDRVHLFYAPIFAGNGGTPLVSGYEVSGGKEQAVSLARLNTRRCGEDLIISGDAVYP